MSFVAGSILGTLGLDINPWRQGFLQAESMMGLFPGMVTNFMAHPLLGLAGIAKSAFGAIKDAFMDSLGRGDKIHDLAATVGVTAEELSRYGFAAEQSSSSTESLAMAIKFLNDNMADAARGNKTMVAEFEGAGVAYLDAAGNARPAIEVLLDLADAIAKTDDATKRQKISTLMGKMGAELIPMMREGAAGMRQWANVSDETGRTITARAAELADSFGDLLGTAKAAWEGIQNAIGEPLRDSLTPVLEDAMAFVRENLPQIRSAISDTITGIMALLKGLKLSLDPIIDAIKAILDGMGHVADFVAQLSLGDKAGGERAVIARTPQQARRDREQGVNVNASVNIDSTATAQQLAKAIEPRLREANRQANEQINRAARRSLIQGGMSY